jgi:hypothetical protein
MTAQEMAFAWRDIGVTTIKKTLAIIGFTRKKGSAQKMLSQFFQVYKRLKDFENLL